jgi:hypothetical protein
MAAPINPTALTPPRVDFLDPRTGAISREWYRFFLSLLTATENNQDAIDSGLDTESLLASLESKYDAAVQALAIEPRDELGTMAALQQANVPWLTFDNEPSPVSPAVGTVRWDGGTTLGVQMTPNVLGRVNEDLYYYIKATANITKGQVVMFTGAVGASGVPTGAPATGVTDGTYIMGVAAENIALNDFGFVQYNGTLRGINTSAFADGDVLWYDPAVTGGLTVTKPAAPNIKVQMAAVINAGPGASGSILIRVTSGSTLGGTDSNVEFGALANNDLIQYDAVNGYWRNISTLNVSSGGTGANTLSANYLLKGNGTSAISASVAYDNGGALGVNTTTAAGRFQVALNTSFTWGGIWGLGTSVFGGAGASDGGLGISYNATDGAALGAIEPGVAWRPVSVFADLVDLCSNGTTPRLRVKPNGQARFIPLASAPAGAEAGDVYYDSGTNKLRCYDGTSWNDLF